MKHKFLFKHFFGVFIAFAIFIGFVSFFSRVFGDGSATVNVTVPSSGFTSGSVQVQVCGVDGANTRVCSTSNSMTVTVASGSVPVVTLTATPSTVAPGGSTTLTWTATNNPTSCTASSGGSWSGSKTASTTPTSETATNITQMTAFTLQCTNASGTGSRTVTVNTTTTPTANIYVTLPNGETSWAAGSPPPDPIVSWGCDASSSSGSVTGSDGNYWYGRSGSQSVNPTSSAVYTLTCIDNGVATAGTASLTVTNSASTISDTLTPTSRSCIISAGQSSCIIGLSWNVSGEGDNDSTAIESTQPITYCNSSGSGCTTVNNPAQIPCNPGYGNYNCPTMNTESVNNPGSQFFAVPYGNQAYNLDHIYAVGSGMYIHFEDDDLDTATLAATCASGTSWDGTKCAVLNGNGNGPSGNGGPILNAGSQVISPGGSTNLIWSDPNASFCQGTNFDTKGSPFSTGTGVSITPAFTKTYTITCSDGNSASTTVTVGKKPVYKEN